MAEYAFPTLHVDGPDDKGILTVGINRPDAKNALDTATLQSIQALLEIAVGDPAVRALVITGHGKLFGIGADLPEIGGSPDPTATKAMIEAGGQVFAHLAAFPKPTAAAINGIFCLGGSLELALACTFRVASKRCRLGLPEIKLGLIPGYGGTQRLPRLIGQARAAELILTGDQVRAEEAESIGLVHKAVENGAEVDEAKAILARVLTNGNEAIHAAMQALQAAATLPLAEGLKAEQEHFLAVRATDAAQAGIDAQSGGR